MNPNTTILGLLITAIASGVTPGIPGWVANASIVVATALSLHEYGRRGGATGAVPALRGATATAAATLVVLLTGVAALRGAGAIVPAAAAAGLGVAVLGAGLRSGAAKGDSGSRLDLGQESTMVVGASAIAGTTLAVASSGFVHAVALLTAGGLLLVGYARRPRARSMHPG